MTDRTILVIAAHPDDEVLGVGGTISKLTDIGDEVVVLIVTDGATHQYDDPSMVEEKERAAKGSAERLGVTQVRFEGLPDMKLDSVPHVEINEVIENAIDEVEPDIIFTHTNHDVNKDHAAVYDATLVASRPQAGVSQVFAYEVPSATEWAAGSSRFAPDVYIDISDHLRAKIDAFGEYTTETRDPPHPRSIENLRGRARVHGGTAGFDAAEAFSLVRWYADVI